MSKRTLAKVESVSDIDAAWGRHIKAANAGNYDRAAGWMTVDDFMEKSNCKRQAASNYLMNAWRDEELDREWIVLNGKRRLMYRPKVKP